jgi:drug/metabolite transporter (DMT)-like permease
MTWYIAAIISAFALSGQALAFQRLQRYFPIKVYLAYVWLGAAFALGLFYFRPSDLPIIWANMLPLTIAALSSLGGIYTYNKAIKVQTNIGYIEGVAAIRIPITYIVSLLLFQAEFDLIRLIGIGLTTYGVYLVAGRLKFERDRFQLDWVIWALAAGLFFALLTIFVRFATDGGISAQLATVYVLFVAGNIFLLSGAVDKTPLRPQASHLWLIIVAIFFATIGNATEFIAFETAPNLAYAVAIDNTRMIILYLVGIIAFSEPPQRIKPLGITLAFLGVVLLS